MDIRCAGDDTNRFRALTQELVGLHPDIILANSTPVTAAVQRVTIPVVCCGRERPRRQRHRPQGMLDCHYPSIGFYAPSPHQQSRLTTTLGIDRTENQSVVHPLI